MGAARWWLAGLLVWSAALPAADPAWFDGGRPRDVAWQAVDALQKAADDGLDPNDYDAGGLRNVLTATMVPVRPAPGKANGRAVLVVPGGGYLFVAIENEGLPVAQRLAEQGYTAFVLVYRVKPTPPADADFEAWLQKDIAERLDLRPTTVATYKARLFDKLGVSNVLDLQRIATLHGYFLS